MFRWMGFLIEGASIIMATAELIQQTIAQHISNPRVLSYSPAKLNEVQGRFIVANRVYNFVLDKKGVSFNPAGNNDSLLFSNLFLDHTDAIKKPKVGNDRCNAGKSFQCGSICLSNHKRCRKGVVDVNDARRIASILASTNEFLKSKVKSEASEEALSRGKTLFEAKNKRALNGKAERVDPNVEPTSKQKTKTASKAKKTVAEKVQPIKNYDEFRKQALVAFRDLNDDYDHGGTVPIHQIRDKIGGAVSKPEFGNYLKKLQSDDAIQLVSRVGGKPMAKDEMDKSFVNSFGDTKTDIRLVDKKVLNGLPERKEKRSEINQKDFDKHLDKLYSDQKQEHDGLVPIYKIRRALGDKVARKDFDKWLLSNHNYQHITGLVTGLTPDKIRDSVKTELGGLRYYIRKV